MKLWDRYLTIRAGYGGGVVDTSFDQFWYEFLIKHMISEETPTELVYNEVCNTMEKRITH
ncbi:hypothetical protein M5X11_38850 [Paenibacillus alginolyticus]|uniref:hypothetical protein n=1 Tax=Bacillales TaxID=1385 RepID=UPI0004927A7B|nr:hypothetical protein [Paenibacillus alginolyticus]MCY9670783.1 hypothetical protein [Paenibacillus alginolyticus]